MNNFEQTRLGSILFAGDGEQHAEEREWLRSSFLQFRQTVTPLANDIARSMPFFTDHSIDHVDSLWETASVVTGDDFPINPAEAFVLGGAFLMHDLGMGLVAYPEGMLSIERDPYFLDSVALFKSALHNMSENEARDAALAQFLRQRHAAQASRLMKHQFGDVDHSFYLLQDAVLRTQFGRIIGLIAESHWFDVEDLVQKLGRPVGSIPQLPRSWTVNPVKLACILRLADAIHLDARRAPLFLRTYRAPTGYSKEHWRFQERMTRPLVVQDRLHFTSTSPFEPNESTSWWLAFDTITMVDEELRKVDALCADTGLPRFAVKSVAGAGSPIRLAEFIPTSGWTPIDASLRVSQVNRVIESLGGKSLYGDRPMVALRELISNGADAVRAKKMQFGGSDLRVEVHLEKQEDEQWLLKIKDNGLGMSSAQMVKFLTDFGNSQWTSPERLEEFPGLLEKKYRSTGRFGIGFFASFMVATRVSVKSLPFRAASSDTHILEFTNGLQGRPLIRRATGSEELAYGGTEVSLYLREAPLSLGGLFERSSSRFSVHELLEVELRRMCLLLDVDLYCNDESGHLVAVVAADAWKEVGAADLYDMLYLAPQKDMDWSERSMYAAFKSMLVEHVEDLVDADSGDIVGRVALAAGLDELVETDQWWWPSAEAKVYVGGMEADAIWHVLGVLVGEPLKADRQSAFPVADPNSLRAWADSQARKVQMLHSRHLRVGMTPASSRCQSGWCRRISRVRSGGAAP